MEEGRNAFKIITGTPTGKRLSKRPRRTWEDNIRMDLKDMGTNMRNCPDSAQDRGSLESPCECGIVSQGGSRF